MGTLDYWLFNSAISASLVLIVGALASLLFRQPAHQQRLGELAFIGATAALLLTAIPGVPKIFLRLLPAQAIAKPTVTRSPFHIGMPPQDAETQNSTTMQNHKNAIRRSPRITILRQGLSDGAQMLGAGYLLGVLVLTGRLTLGWVLLRRAKIRAAALTGIYDAPIADLTGTPWSGSRKAVILVSDDVCTPTACGLFHPAILFPRSLVNDDRTTIRIALAHEVAHIRRGDTISRMLCAVVGALFFYNPLYWLLRRRIRLNQEFLADQTAAQAATSCGVYIELMLALAKSVQRQKRPLFPAAGLIGGRSDFYIRMHRLMQFGIHDDSPVDCSRRWLGSAAAGMVLVILPASFLTLGSPQPAEVKHHRAQSAVTTQAGAFELIHRGLSYLGHRQNPDGGWLGRYGPAVTALVVRGYIEAGAAKTNRHVRSAINFIERSRHMDGGFYGNVEPAYNTAIVLRTLSMLPRRRYQRQARAGLAFLRGQMDQLSRARRSKDTWSGKPSVFKAWPGPQSLVPIRHNGATTTDQIAAGLWMSANQLDPTERSGDMILTHYGEITYSQLKSMIYAGLSPRDPRVIRLARWIAAHYTLSHNPAENGSLGVYYYYVTFAKTLRATGRAWIVGSTGVRHNWRRDLVYALAHRINGNGSWVNHGSKAWLEGNPVMATTYAVLALDQVVR